MPRDELMIQPQCNGIRVDLMLFGVGTGYQAFAIYCTQHVLCHQINTNALLEAS